MIDTSVMVAGLVTNHEFHTLARVVGFLVGRLIARAARSGC